MFLLFRIGNIGLRDADKTTKVYFVILLDTLFLVTTDNEPENPKSTLYLQISISLDTEPKIFIDTESDCTFLLFIYFSLYF